MGTGLLMIVLALAIGFALGAAIFWLRLRENGRRLVRAEARARVLRRELAITRYDASQARTLLAALLDAYSQPVMITTSERVILLANTAALALIGLPREQVIGRVVASVLQDYDTTRLLQGAAQSGQPGDHTFQRAITGQTWRATVTPLRLGLPAMLVVGHAADDSATPETPEQSATIPVSAETSAEPVSHLILTIEDLTALKRLEITRRDFVAHVSHELRTPLAAVKLLAETLLNALDRDPDAAREFGQRIMDEVDHLTQMVNELLELSRIESGALQLHPEPTDIDSLIEVVVERMTPLANACGVRLSAETLDTLPDALVDGERIAEALINLIDNGLKYTPSG
ncbi:MAG TPA: histidine kinase dimerization/phospho-acceptor domain-containing protein, partial [Ktedonobacterales bacterium]|nr:histidine kinase dimerization/phospho-acceptor domain-containing protein [Ktedonobacterales bacterium]